MLVYQEQHFSQPNTFQNALVLERDKKRCKPSHNKLRLDSFEGFQIGIWRTFDETPEISEVWSWKLFTTFLETFWHSGLLSSWTHLSSLAILSAQENTHKIHKHVLLLIARYMHWTWWAINQLKYSRQLQHLLETHRWDQKASIWYSTLYFQPETPEFETWNKSPREPFRVWEV